MEQPTTQLYTHSWLKTNPENFPVASRFIPAEYRAEVMALYQFARGADDIADDPVMHREAKRKALSQLDEALFSGKTYDVPDWALSFIELARTTPKLATHARDLLSAFLQDTEQSRYQTFDDLMHYCLRSAAPVGRAYLDIAGEKQADRRAADALCNALQILNHVRDASKDYLVLGRIYMPTEWMQEAGVSEEDFSASRSSAAMRKLFEHALRESHKLLIESKPLCKQISNEKLRLEISCILQCAFALHAKLLRLDPLHARVNLSLFEKFLCLVKAWLKH